MSKKATQKTTEARVTVYPRKEILDPQGKAIRGALARLGFENVASVRAGKSFEIRLEGVSGEAAVDLAREMASKLLANPVVEDFSVELLDGDGDKP